jgi:hypothetical protein
MPVWSAFTLDTLGTMVSKLIVRIHTGNDDLRGLSDPSVLVPSRVEGSVSINNVETTRHILGLHPSGGK